MIKNISIRARLGLAMGFLAALLVIGGLMGVVGVLMSNRDVKELYADRLASSQALGQSNVALSRARLWLYRIALDPAGPEVEQETQTAHDLLDASKTAWDAYRALPFSGPEEARRAADVNGKYDALVANGLDQMFSAIATRDAAKIPQVWRSLPPALFIDVSDGMDSLGEIQVTAARALFDSAQARFRWFVWVAALGIAIALAAAVFAWWSLQRAVGLPLARALDHFKAIADGDLTSAVEVHSDDEMGQLMSGLDAMQGKLVRTIGVVRKTSQSIKVTTQEISASNLDLSQRTEEQAASLEQTAASMDELTSTVRQNAENAKQANEVVRNTTQLTERGNRATQDVVQTMRGLSDSSGKIAEIIGAIEGIAFQTNILSLNAAVEAARADEQGRGFAVVAGEVRSLAQRSATASREIKGLITDSLKRVEAGARQADSAIATMEAILDSIRKASALMSEIASASEAQSKDIEQVNRAVSEMDHVTQQNAALVEQASAAALSMKEQAGQLDNAVSVFVVGKH